MRGTVLRIGKQKDGATVQSFSSFLGRSVEGWIQVVKKRTVIRRSSSHEVNRFTENAIEMHENRKGDQAMWLNSVCGTRVLQLEPEGC